MLPSVAADWSFSISFPSEFPVSMFRKVCLILALWLVLIPRARAETWHTTASRHGIHFVVRLSHPHLLRRVPLIDGVRWDFHVSNHVRNRVFKPLTSGPLASVLIVQRGHFVHVTARWRFPFNLKPWIRSDRIVIFIPYTINRTTKVVLGPGLVLERFHRWTLAGPEFINVLIADLRNHTLAPKLAQTSHGFCLERVSTLAREARAIAAINGTFFSPRGPMPIGLLVVNGQIVSSNYINRSVFGIRYNGTCFINNARLKAAIYLSDDRIFIANAVNHSPCRDQLTLYTSQWGASTRTVVDPSRIEFAISKDGTILSKSHGDSPIPPQGFVVSAQGSMYGSVQARFTVGMKAIVYTQLSHEWEGVKSAIEGGPTLVLNGHVEVTARQEHFGAEIARGRAPRTAIGYLGGTKVLMVTVDGRQKDSVGMTLYELARLMRSLGARDAINLDGGGSTAMVVGGKLVNRPSDGVERAVSDALVLKSVI